MTAERFDRPDRSGSPPHRPMDLSSDRSPRLDAIAIWNAGLDAVLAGPLVSREMRIEDDSLFIDHHAFHRDDFDRVLVVGAGKAAAAMAAAIAQRVRGWLPINGWVNVPEGTQQDIPGVVTHPARPASVNEPIQEGILGTRRMLDMVSAATPRDLVLTVICGGGSALMPLPKSGVTLQDKLAVIRLLSSRGANINQLNTVRKHLSDVKGGGLLRACRGGHLVTILLSDVLGDPVDLIASGPTVPDSSGCNDAFHVLSKFDPDRTLPESVYRCLQAGSQQIDTAPTCPSTLVMLGNNALAVDQAGIMAESLGYNHVMQSATHSEGAAEDVGRHLADMTVGMLRADAESHRTDCLITGGEPTVHLADAKVRGKGGRNMQLVLAAYQRLLEHQLSEDQWSRVAILSGGTDGEDGPTDAAGAIMDASVHRSAQQQSLDISGALDRNDAYTFFKTAGGLLMTGPTGTNVCDVRVALVTRSEPDR